MESLTAEESKNMNKETDTKKDLSPEEEESSALHKMSVIDHLEELRGRIIFTAITWVTGSVAGWYLSPWLITYIKRYPQLENIKLILFRPPEAFFVRMKLAMTFGMLIALPIIIVQIMLFVLPGLYDREKKWVLRFVPFSILLFYAGAAFSLFVLLPITLQFFLVQMVQGIAEPNISLEEYVNYMVAMVLVGGLVFQMPIVLFFLTLMGVLTSKKLASGRRYAILIIFIVAAIATPPDPFSQVVVAVPMLILYELCIWASRMAGR